MLILLIAFSALDQLKIISGKTDKELFGFLPDWVYLPTGLSNSFFKYDVKYLGICEPTTNRRQPSGKSTRLVLQKTPV